MYVYFKTLFGQCHALGFSRRRYIAVDYLHFQSWPCAICGGKIGTDFPLIISVFLFQYQSEKYFTLSHLSLTVHNLSDLRRFQWF